MARLRVKGGLGPGPDGSSSDLDAGDGELFVLAGANGTRPRTLLREIAGLDRTPFEVLVDDHPVHRTAPEDRGIGFVFQSGALFPHLTVGENLGFSLRARGAPRFQIEERVSEAARLTGIGPLLEKRPGALTHVERLRAAVARSLVRRPHLLLLDDPLGLADRASVPDLREELGHLHRRTGLTMVLSTTQPSDALAMASRLALFAGGVLRQVGTPRHLISEPADRFVAATLGTPPMNLVRLGVDSGCATFGGVSLAMPDHREVVLGLSADDLSLVPLAVPSVTFHGFHLRAEIEGARALAWVEVSGERLRVRCDSSQLLRMGAQVTLSIDLGRLRLFSADALGRSLPWVFPAPRPLSVLEAERAAVARSRSEEVTVPAAMSPAPADADRGAISRSERTLVDPPADHASVTVAERTIPLGDDRTPGRQRGETPDTDASRDHKSAVA